MNNDHRPFERRSVFEGKPDLSGDASFEGCPALLLSGLDSLYVSYFLDTATSDIDWAELAFRKEQARSRSQALSETELGSERFALMPYGRKPYSYILSNKAFEIRLAEHMSPSCHVQFFSEALWRYGIDALEDRLLAWFASAGLRQLRGEIVSRADWAFDHALGEPDFEADWFVSRAKKDSIHRDYGKVQTFTLGRGQIVIRVYDKVAEIEQQSGKVWFHQLWGQEEGVWRVEFQIRGERLKEAAIRSLDDLRALQGDLLREIATGHTTLRIPATDGNRSRWPLHPLWKAVRAAIAALPQSGLVRDLDDEQPLEYLLNESAKSVYGHFKNMAGLLHGLSGGKIVPDLEFVLAELPDLLRKHHRDFTFRSDVEERIRKRFFGMGR